MNIAPPRRIRTALFPVAGLGTRFLPATKAMPKEMLPIVDKPLIQYAVEEAVAAGIEHVVLITHRTKRAIEDHFDASQELEKFLELQGKHALLYELRASFPAHFSLSCVRQSEPLGLGHALLCARHLVGDEPFAVLLPDDLIQAPRPVLAEMVQQYQRTGGSMVAIERMAQGRRALHGVVDAHPAGERIGRLAAIVERPSPSGVSSFSGLVGRYLFSPGIFDALAEASPAAGQELQIADGLNKLIGREPVFAYRFEGRSFDCGSKLGFLEATVNFALDHPELGDAFAKILGQLAQPPAVRGRRASVSGRASAAPAVPN